MLDIIFISLSVVTIIFWLASLFIGDEYLSERRNSDGATAKGATTIVLLVLSLVLSAATWYAGIRVSIQRNLAQIKAYETYKSNYDSTHIIDTVIEKDYVDALQKLEYYKSIGLYDGQDFYNEFVQEVSGTERDFVKKNAKRITSKLRDQIIENGLKSDSSDNKIEKYGINGEVKGRPGRLYNEKFYEEVGPGAYKEMN